MQFVEALRNRPLVRRGLAARAWSREQFLRLDDAAVRLYAAAIAYRAIFAVISLASVLVLFAWFGRGRMAEITALFPDDIEEIAEGQARQILKYGQTTIVIATIIGGTLALWGLIGAFSTVYDALGRIYGKHTYTPLVRRYMRAAVLAATFTLALGSSFVILVSGTDFGSAVLEAMGLDELTFIFTATMTWIVIPIIATASFALVLRWGSSVRPPWANVIAGAVVTGTGWVFITLGFAAAARWFSLWDTYGALASAAILLLYGYWTAYLLLTCAVFGDELGSVLRWFRSRRASDEPVSNQQSE